MPVGFKKVLGGCRVGLSGYELDLNLKELSKRRKYGKTWNGIHGVIWDTGMIEYPGKGSTLTLNYI